MGTLLRPATPIPSRWSPSKRGWLSTSRQTFECNSYQPLKKLPAKEGRRQPLNTQIGPTRSAVRDVNVSSAAGNSTESTHSERTAEPQGDRKQGHISVLYTNVRSLIPKRDELLAYIATEEPDVIGSTETWVNSSHLMSELSIAGYESFHKNREYKKGDGIICYVKSTLSALKMGKQDAGNSES